MKLSENIVNLKIKNNLLEDDFEYSKSVEWYDYALNMRLVEVIFDRDELIGFMTVVRLGYIPRNINDIELDYNIITSGSVAFVAEICARNIKELLFMRKKFFERYIGVKYIVWHNKKTDKLEAFKHIRRQKYEDASKV